MKKIFLLSLCIFTVFSCSSIVNGSKQKVKINSETGKVISVYDKYGDLIAKGKGSLEVELPRGNDFYANYPTGIQPSYTVKTETEAITLLSRPTIAYWLGNAFTLGIGYLVDNGVGAENDIIYRNQKVNNLNLK